MSRAIFLDDGGVLFDNRVRAVQWQRDVRDFASRGRIWKGGPEYSEAVFAHAGVAAAEAIVVDDNAGPIEWARATGANAFRMDRDRASGDASALGDLDELMDRL